MDINRARKEINYSPKTSITDGLKTTWEWFKDNSNEYLDRQNYFK